MGGRQQQQRRLPLLLWALLGLLHPGAPGQSVRHTYENVKLLQISVRPPAPVQISANEEGSLQDQEYAKSAEEVDSKDEEKTLNDLVGVLQDMVKEIPTAEAPVALQTIPIPTILQPTAPPVVMTSIVEATHSETIDAALDVLTPTSQEEHVETSESVVMTKEISSASPTALLELPSSTSESIVLHADKTTTEKPLISLSVFIEKATTKKKIKSFDQLTNGALSNLVQSLEKVKKLNGILDTFTKETVLQENKGGKVHKKKPTADEILDLIEELIKTIKSTPAYVKEDRNLYTNIQIAERYIKQALELTAEAEKKLQHGNNVLPSTPLPTPEMKVSLVPVPSLPAPTLAAPTVIVESASPPLVPLAKKTEDTQLEMGKLKAFVNLLYGFTPQLVTYTHNSAHKKVAEDIVERALAVLEAIKSVFCGKEEAQSKQVLKQLLKEDMELVNQAMKAKRVS